MVKRTKITISRIHKPSNESLNDDLQWFSDSLGLFGNRDKNKSCFRMFIVLLRSLHDQDGLTSDELAERVKLSRGTVVHHLHKLIDSGLVVNDRSRYMLRVNNLSTLIDEIETDLYKTLSSLRDVANDIDKRLRL